MRQQATPARKDDGESNRISLRLKRIATAWRSLPGLRGGIGLRLLVRVLLFSLVVTLLLTLMQLYLDYRRDVEAIDQRISEIDSGYRRSIGEGFWKLDTQQLQLQAEGILHLPDISYVGLREATDRANPLVVTAGSRQANPAARREFRIYYTNHGAEQLVGFLVVEATYDRIYRQLFDTAAVILLIQAIMTFIVSFFILLIVDRLITRHLNKVAASLGGYDLRGDRMPIQLDRHPPRSADELDRLVGAFNLMDVRLQEREKHLTATSEVLRTISNAPSDLRSALDSVAKHAARLCSASNARIWRLEGNVLRLVATYGESSATMDGREGLPVDRFTVTGRAACDRRTIHVHDIAAEDREYPLGSRIVKGQGWHTTLATPLLREGAPVGTILVRRMEVRPFDDQQIALLETFADQAAIAIENVRLFEVEKQRALALAHANRDLAEREARIRRLVDSNIIGIFIWNFDGRILEANDEFLRMVGYDREDLVAGRIKWAVLTPPDWRDRNDSRIEQQKGSGRFDPFEKEYARKDGRRVPVLIGGATFEEGGNEGVAFVLDLTQRKRGEERLRVQHTVAQILAEAATIEDATPRLLRAMGECLGWDVGVLWRVDREAEALRCVELWHNESMEVPEFERISRNFKFVQGVGLPGRVWSNLKPEYIPDVTSDTNFPRGPIARCEGLHAAFGFPILLGGEVLGVIEFFSREIRKPDQELLDMLATIGSQIGQFIERQHAEESFRKAEMQLAHANRITTMGQLTASIAHEVSQPIAATKINAHTALRWLNRDAPNLEEVRQLLARVASDGERAGNVISRIRDLVRKAPPRLEPLHINEVIGEVVQLTRGEAMKNGISVQTRFAEGLPVVTGDRTQLQQLILNLILNAVQAMAESEPDVRELEINTQTNRSDGVLVSVRDSGPGISPESFERLFEAFYTTKPAGMGMGLAICRSIVEAHGGRIWATANVPQGAAFYFTLAAAPE